MDLLFLPLNLNENHRTYLVVDGSKATTYGYDSMDKRANNKLLTELAEELEQVFQRRTRSHPPTRLFKNMEIVAGYSCEAGNYYSSRWLLRRRWDIPKTIMDFSDESKGKVAEDCG
ncbi:hypothetical protein PHMEG_000788 [Phytophthora megakarya]|uniref:Ubiquitin-like protease family profile domain-containing protein n=1 Tax=Phytophthora megakarya TaxID=4795 RepID=A0A225X378_9STRA|nr:hypothetical protein PHMEG_000788 [Phytophthora megakarya]